MNKLRYLLSAWLIAVLTQGLHAQKFDPTDVISRIAFGSCSHQNDADQMWPDVLAIKPQLWIWGGDNIYGDTHDMEAMRKMYDLQKAAEGYWKLRRTCPIIGTWDDHDYGTNDGGKNFNKKKESKDLFMEFLDVNPRDPMRTHEGVYSSYTFGSGKKKVKVINLDTRYFRDTLSFVMDSLNGRPAKRYVPNPTGDLLGAAQWQWLELELRLSDAEINIINSSIQVLSEEHQFEKWANFPAARRRLLDLVAASGAKGVIIISGDRHIAEISKTNLPGMAYPLYDFTSSGLTHTWSSVWEEKNKYRVGELIIQKTFGLLSIDWSGKTPSVKMEIRGNDGKVYGTETITF